MDSGSGGGGRSSYAVHSTAVQEARYSTYAASRPLAFAPGPVETEIQNTQFFLKLETCYTKHMSQTQNFFRHVVFAYMCVMSCVRIVLHGDSFFVRERDQSEGKNPSKRR